MNRSAPSKHIAPKKKNPQTKAAPKAAKAAKKSKQNTEERKSDVEMGSEDEVADEVVTKKKPKAKAQSGKKKRPRTTRESDDEGDDAQSAEEDTGAKKAPAKKRKLDRYTFNRAMEDETKRKKSQNIQYFLRLNPGLKQEMAERLTRITSDTDPQGMTPIESTLRSIYKKGNEAANSRTYPSGKGKGKTTTVRILDVDIDVRVDKSKNGIWLRVSQKGQPDKDTQALANAIDKYTTQRGRDAFLLGVHGGKPAKKLTGALLSAYKDGVEARMVGILSDFMDFPGNSVVAEKLLAKADTPEAYKHLFTGELIGNEQSFGALPSQNQTNILENDTERTSAYNAMGKLLSSGEVMISDTDAGGTNGRKMISMLEAMEDMFTVQKRGANQTKDKNIANKEFTTFIRQKSIIQRNDRQEESFYRGIHTLSDDEGSDEEKSKQNMFTDEKKQQRTKRLKRTASVASDKFGAVMRGDPAASNTVQIGDLLLMTTDRKLSNLSRAKQRQLEKLLREANGLSAEESDSSGSGSNSGRSSSNEDDSE